MDEVKIFLHQCDLDKPTIAQLKKHGVIPVRVESLDDVRLVTGAAMPVSGGKLLWAALKAMGTESYNDKTQAAFVKTFQWLLEQELGIAKPVKE